VLYPSEQERAHAVLMKLKTAITIEAWLELEALIASALQDAFQEGRDEDRISEI